MFLIFRGNEALTDVTENETAENPRLLEKFQNGVGISKKIQTLMNDFSFVMNIHNKIFRG